MFEKRYTHFAYVTQYIKTDRHFVENISVSGSSERGVYTACSRAASPLTETS